MTNIPLWVYYVSGHSFEVTVKPMAVIEYYDLPSPGLCIYRAVTLIYTEVFYLKKGMKIMTDNEIKREQDFIDRIAVFKKRTTDFFADYENPTGSEDRLEICLIRDGCRAVTQAEEIINRQKANAEGLTNAVKFLNEQLSSAKAEAVKEFATDVINNILPKYMQGHSEQALKISLAISERVKEKAGES